MRPQPVAVCWWLRGGGGAPVLDGVRGIGQPERVPVVVMGRASDEAAAYAAGCDAFVVKPAAAGTLSGVLRALV